MRRRIAKTLESFPWLVCESVMARCVGYAYASQHRERAAYRWSVDVSAYVRDGSSAHGRGACTLHVALRSSCVCKAFTRPLAGITLPNPGSVGLHESMGFQPVGVYRAIGFKCGEWHDVAWYQLALCERSGEPADPLAFDIVRKSSEWTDALASGSGLVRLPMRTEEKDC